MMSNVAIKVENLSKVYTIGARREQYPTLRGALTSGFKQFMKLQAFRQIGNNSLKALDDVSFEVKHGDVLGIIGRNGAGKSTLLKLLSHITEPSQGRISLYGRVGSLLEVGTGFHPELTGRDNIYLNGAILGMRRAEIAKKFDEIVDFAEIDKLLDTPVKHYSSGMYVRLAFAVAAHMEPEILLIDEVLAVGDAEFQKKCLGKMGDVAQSGRTVLFVSHNMAAIERICNSAMILNKGKIVEVGNSVDQIIRSYLSNSISSEKPSWDNTGITFDSPYFSPIQLYLSDEQGNIKQSPIKNDDDDVWIRLIGNIERLDPALTIGFAIYAENHEMLFWSYQTDQAESLWPVLKIGTNELKCRLQPHLLNEGTYYVKLVGGLHNRAWIFAPSGNTPSFSFIVSGGLSNSPLWFSRRPGLLAPVLHWSLVTKN